jgi:GMP synthase (glutamine-hydrolysing)
VPRRVQSAEIAMLNPPTDKPVLVVQHEAAAHAGTLLEALVNAGMTVDVRQLHTGAGLPVIDELERQAALIVLGGSMNVDQAGEYEFIEEEQRLLRAAVESDVPVLGVCLGGQQLAAAFGGDVYARPESEVGWLPVDIVRQDALFAGIVSPFNALEWHAQSFTAPAAATVLAVRDDDPGVQAFRVGRRAWGVQFHPEVDESMLAHWIRDDTEGLRQRDLDRIACLHELMPNIIVESLQLCRQLINNFVASF